MLNRQTQSNNATLEFTYKEIQLYFVRKQNYSTLINKAGFLATKSLPTDYAISPLAHLLPSIVNSSELWFYYKELNKSVLQYLFVIPYTLPVIVQRPLLQINYCIISAATGKGTHYLTDSWSEHLCLSWCWALKDICHTFFAEGSGWPISIKDLLQIWSVASLWQSHLELLMSFQLAPFRGQHSKNRQKLLTSFSTKLIDGWSPNFVWSILG
jgi:hypothetical protein